MHRNDPACPDPIDLGTTRAGNFGETRVKGLGFVGSRGIRCFSPSKNPLPITALQQVEVPGVPFERFLNRRMGQAACPGF